MEGLTSAEIDAILNPQPKQARLAKSRKYTLDSEGNLVYARLEHTSEISRYEGRAGSIRRNRKGATRRLANGRRYFVPNHDENIIAYKVG